MSEETIPQMRDRIDALEVTVKERDTTIVGLESTNHKFAARDAFRDEGFAANHGDLYAAANPDGDITKESVLEFADQFNLGKAESEAAAEGAEGDPEEAGDGTDAKAPGSPDLGKLERGGSSSSDGSGGAALEKMTIPEWQALMLSDPVAGKEAQRQGRVAVSGTGIGGDGKPVAPGVNPYASKPE